MTGLSRGGRGTWIIPDRTMHRIAAIVPVCGRHTSVAELRAVRDLPIWSACNDGDALPTVKYQLKAISFIENSGGEKFLKLNSSKLISQDFLKKKHIFSSYNKTGHNAWDETYSSIDIYKWMLSFQSNY